MKFYTILAFFVLMMVAVMANPGRPVRPPKPRPVPIKPRPPHPRLRRAENGYPDFRPQPGQPQPLHRPQPIRPNPSPVRPRPPHPRLRREASHEEVHF